MLSKNFKTTLTRIATAGVLCSAIVACSDTTVGTRSFEETESFTIPGFALSLGQLTLPTIGIPLNLAEQEGYSDGDFDFVTSVKVRDIVFDIAPSSNEGNGEDGNLDTFEFVSSLTLALQATVDGVQQTVEIADLPMNDPQIASNATTLVMNVNDEQDIRDLIQAPSGPGGPTILVTISGTNPPDSVDVDAKIRFRVGIGFR